MPDNSNTLQLKLEKFLFRYICAKRSLLTNLGRESQSQSQQ